MGLGFVGYEGVSSPNPHLNTRPCSSLCPPCRVGSVRVGEVTQHTQPPRPSTCLLSPRTYKHEALRKKFTRARDVESSDDEGYDWGPATDL